MFFRAAVIGLLALAGLGEASLCGRSIIFNAPPRPFFSTRNLQTHSVRELSHLKTIEKLVNVALEFSNSEALIAAIRSGMGVYTFGVEVRGNELRANRSKFTEKSFEMFHLAYQQFLVQMAQLLNHFQIPHHHPVWDEMEAVLTAAAISLAGHFGHSAKMTKFKLAGLEYRGVAFAPKRSSEFQKFEKAVYDEVPGRPTRIAYLPGLLLRMGGAAFVAEDILALSHDFILGFRPTRNERHEFRHVQLEGALARGEESHFHGLSQAMDPKHPLPQHRFEQQCSYHEAYSYNEPWNAYMDFYDSAQAYLASNAVDTISAMKGLLADASFVHIQAARSAKIFQSIKAIVRTYHESTATTSEVIHFIMKDPSVTWTVDTYLLERSEKSYFGCSEVTVVGKKKWPVMVFINPESQLHMIPLLDPVMREICLDFEAELKTFHQTEILPTTRTRFPAALQLLRKTSEILVARQAQLEAMQKVSGSFYESTSQWLFSGDARAFEASFKILLDLKPIPYAALP